VRVALVTTTISVPRVLALYRRLDPAVAFFVAGDRRTPHDDVRRFLDGLGNATYYSDADQEGLGYGSSPLKRYKWDDDGEVVQELKYRWATR
jgi:hypothetical protein